MANAGSRFLVNYNKSDKGRAKSAEIANRLYDCETCGEQVKSGINLHNHRRYSHGYNHKVVSVERIGEREDVYCLTVPEYHNFALEAGVFVHNCGMAAIKTPFKSSILEGKLKDLRHQIERTIPVGFNDHKEAVDESLAWKGWKSFSELHKGVQHRKDKAMRQLGTLGGGNHFVEVCLDTDDNVWLMLHSGSRNIGNEVASRHIETAKSLHKLSDFPTRISLILFKDRRVQELLARFGMVAGVCVQNREIMMKASAQTINRMFNDGEIYAGNSVNCHHNYVSPEIHFGEGSLRHAQRRDSRRPGNVWNYSRLDGREIVYRVGFGKRAELQFLLARRGSQDVANAGEKSVHARGFGTPRRRASNAAKTRA
jgi:tRNA-splicing ligase RtcB